MLSTLTLAHRRALLGAALLLAGALPAPAQHVFGPPAPSRPAEYMTLTMVESPKQEFARLLLAPSFHASSAYLEGYDSFSEDGNSWAYQRNQERLAKQLNELATEGWEVLEVHPAPYLPTDQAYCTRYLLRRPRP